MLTFNVFRRDDSAIQHLKEKKDFAGWEQTVHVYKEDVLLCQINTAQAHCCGWNTIEKTSGLTYLDGNEIALFWKEVKGCLGPVNWTNRPVDFPVGQLFCLHNESFQKTDFYKESKGEVVYSYISASEPGHKTYLYKFDLCSS